jgi:3-phosphoshikimate 1-carboxyvinyltransferase
MDQRFYKVKKVKGELAFKGDKSISHRTLIFAAMASGKSKIQNLSDGLDVAATIKCLKQIGVTIVSENDSTVVSGAGYHGFRKPESRLNCFNSGTTARLLSGLLVAQNFNSTLFGDQSLSKRPMKRVIEPLQLMGGQLSGSTNDTLPISINPSSGLKSIRYELNVPSAQVKSAILIAGLHIDSETNVIETYFTRDHTERLLGLNVEKIGNLVISKSSIKNYPSARDYFIPGDISSASFLIIAALLIPNSELIIRNVSLNPTRTALIELLNNMDAGIEVTTKAMLNNEKYGDLLVKSSELKNITIPKDIVPLIIDEIPILAIAGIFAEGRFEIQHTGELRFKESDRIKAICFNLKNAGLVIEEYEDGFSIDGKLKNSEIIFESFGDHRIAMACSILAMKHKYGGTINGFECVNVSNPEFLEQINSVCEFS